MNKLLCAFISCSLALSLSLPSGAFGQESDMSDDINRIIDGINLHQRLNRTPEEMQTQLQNNPFGLETEENGRLLTHFSDAFHPDTLMRLAREEFEHSFNRQYADRVIEWLNQDVTRKVHGAEEEFYTTEGTRKRIIRMYELEQDTLPQARQILMADLVNATSAADSRVEAYTTIFRAFLSAFSAVNSQQTLTDSEIDEFAKNYRANISRDIRRELVNRYLILYYDLDNETLEKFISFYRTDAGLWLNRTATSSLTQAYDTASERFVRAIKEQK